MRKYIFGILALICAWTALLSMRVNAQEGDRILLDEKGMITLVSSQIAKDGAATLSFSIAVDAANAESAEFLFEESSAKILEYRYNQEEKKLNIYMADTKALFPEGTTSLTIGRIVVRDGNGAAASAKVSVPAESLQYVYGSEVKTVEGMEASGTVQINGADAPPVQTASPSPSPLPAQTASPSPSPKPVQPSSSSDGNRESNDQPAENESQGPGANSAVTGNDGQGTGSNGSGATTVRVPQSTVRPSEPTDTPEAPTQTPGTEIESSDQSINISAQAPMDSGGSQEEEEAETEGQIDWIFILAIASIVIFAGVAAMAFLTLSRKPRR